jgi:hypothetical protein
VKSMVRALLARYDSVVTNKAADKVCFARHTKAKAGEQMEVECEATERKAS